MIFNTYNEMITKFKELMQSNLNNDFKVSVEKHTYKNGHISYYLDIRILEKYRI